VLREEGEVQKSEWGGILQAAQCEAVQLVAEIDTQRRRRDDLLGAIADDARAEAEFVAMLVEAKLEGARLALEIDEIRMSIREKIKVQVRLREAERIRQASFIDFEIE